jgi:hypothetical protein
MRRIQMKRTRSILAGLIITVGGGMVGCHSSPTSLGVPLEYSPSAEGTNATFDLPTHPAKLFVAPVTDNRPDKDSIGVNEESESKHIPILAEQVTPQQYVHDSIVEQLRSDGIIVVDSPAEADRVLNVTLLKFWAVETATYHANVQVEAAVTDRSGAQTLWNGLASGEGTTFGRSLNAGNYAKVFSTSMTRLTMNLVTRAEFIKSLSTQ